MKKVIKKTVVKKPMAKKPMMKSGGAKKSLRKYQGEEGGSEVGPTPMSPSSVPTSTPAAEPKARTFADAYAANIAAGLKPGKARKIAMRELGLKKPVDSGAIIGAAGQIGSALINTLGNRGGGSGGMGPGGGPFKKGGAMKKAKCAKCGGAKMKKGGSAGSIVGGPKYGNNPRTDGRILKKGGSAKSFPDLTGDGKVTKADVLKGRGVIKKKGGVAKAKFGSSVPVQHSPAAGKVRSSSGVGTVAVGKRKKMGGTTRRK